MRDVNVPVGSVTRMSGLINNIAFDNRDYKEKFDRD